MRHISTIVDALRQEMQLLACGRAITRSRGVAFRVLAPTPVIVLRVMHGKTRRPEPWEPRPHTALQRHATQVASNLKARHL